MGQGLPTTFVPGRNLIFLTAAAAYAYRQGIRHLVIGVCETDFSGYPDCRDDTVKAMREAGPQPGHERPLRHPPRSCGWTRPRPGAWRRPPAEAGFVEAGAHGHPHLLRGGARRAARLGPRLPARPACELRARGWAQYASETGEP